MTTVVLTVGILAAVGLLLAGAADSGFEKLKGRWVRPDGGYVLEIRAVDSRGAIDAAYLNPRPTVAAGADFSPQETAHLAHGAIPFTATFEDPRFPGMRFPTTRPIEGVTTTPLEVDQGRAGSSAVEMPR
jgi:hypothetical protein